MPEIQTVFIHDPVIIIFIAQDAVEKIADVPVGRDISERSVSAASLQGADIIARTVYLRAADRGLV